MRTVVGVFVSQLAAERAIGHLKAVGATATSINLLLPGETTLEGVPTTETEQPGVAQAVGAVVGGATGAMAGLSIAATLLLPGVGLVTAIGVAAAATLTAAGALGGAAAGAALEDALDHGLPIDEVYVYEDALRQGRAIVMVEIEAGLNADLVRTVLAEDGAESIDSARQQWWAGLRSAEEAEYHSSGGDFAANEAAFRRGFEVAQLPRVRDKSYNQARAYLRARYPDVYSDPAFRRGYERGWQHRQSTVTQADRRRTANASPNARSKDS